VLLNSEIEGSKELTASTGKPKQNNWMNGLLWAVCNGLIKIPGFYLAKVMVSNWKYK
jgi:hypothetical protein